MTALLPLCYHRTAKFKKEITENDQGEEAAV